MAIDMRVGLSGTCGMGRGTGHARYENGGVYKGEFRREQRCGWGHHTFPTGDQYEGEWLADKIHGQGRHTFLDGSYFEGHWANGERIKGKFVCGDGNTEYTGQWRGDVRHGHGVLFQKGLLKYTGEWANDIQEGRGMCQWADGTEYKGTWKEGVRHGRGIFTRPDGYVYDGEWRDDSQHGQGSCRFDDGSRYEGSWEKGQRSGEGKCRFANGDIYAGLWSADAQSGKGTCAYENGDKYTGEWVNGQRQGYGICKFADGSKFKGEWEGNAWVQSLAHRGHTKAKGPGLSRAHAGSPATFTILAKDELRNRRLCGGDVFAVHLTGPNSIEGSVMDNDDGTYTVTYTATLAGQYQLSITMDDGDVADSPYPTRVLPGRPSARHCTVTGDGRRSATVGQPAQFIVEARDEFGNSCDSVDPEEHLPLEVMVKLAAVELPVMVEAQEDGCYTCSYQPISPGYHRLEILCNGLPLRGSPFSVKVEAGTDTVQVLAHVFGPIEDQVKKWEIIAAKEYQFDGLADGWDSDVEEEETPEQKYIKAHPDVPVVENMEDMWKVSKLQRERKRREGQAAALREARAVKAEHAERAAAAASTVDPPQTGQRATSGQGRAEVSGQIGAKLNYTEQEVVQVEECMPASVAPPWQPAEAGASLNDLD
ncbi:hypothetical protein WJX75_005923 [Coccomyxa subellipsoidea]|uniref:Histone H3 K4-specific methyltransferase SET7/9 N-terminal domain-containing protein n=1 Tax=Coccomyxa subellipsoidea TaxID=248742 RepID=A0ABR2YF90_9CHLO